jgi:anti-sigma factor RsiW
MNCEEIQSRLSWYLDGEAPDIEPHLAGCEACRAKLEALRRADALLAKAADRMAPAVPSRAAVIARRVTRRRAWPRAVGWAAAILVAGFIGTWIYVNARTADPQEVLVFGAKAWVAGAPGVLRVVVRDGLRQVPIAGARVRAWLGDARAEAVSGPDGSAEIRLPAPEKPATVRIDVSSQAGRDRIEREIAVVRPARIMVSTDKPLYQPAQTIHIRALAMNNFTMKPLEGELTLEVEDPNGNRVFKRTLRTSAFGIAAADFVLADEVNLGTYRIRAIAEGVQSERTIEVKRYVLPKFKVDLRPDRGFYGPGETLRADLEARYLFGKPVAAGEARVELSTWVADGFKAFKTVALRTDESGRASFEAKLPGMLFGTDLARGDAVLRIEAVVTDGAGHVERKAVASTVTREPLRVQVFPEGGEYVPGVPGEMFIVASYPDGRPARATVEVGGDSRPTDETGVLLMPVPAEFFTVKARDASGLQCEKQVDLRTLQGEQDFILRTDRVSYRAGETAQLTVLGTYDGTVYVDLVKADQTLLTRSVEVRGGRGTLAVDLPPELFGTVRVSGYRISRDGRIMRDSRLVVVDLPGDLCIRPTLRKDPFAPGEEIEVDFEVLDAGGKPVIAALGLAVVDEAVFALHEARPGLEKVYFQIEEDLLKPRWQLKPAAPLTGPSPTPVRLAAAVEPEFSALVGVRFFEKVHELRQSAEEFNDVVSTLLAWAVGLGILGGLVWLGIAMARRGKLVDFMAWGCFLFLLLVMGTMMTPVLMRASKMAIDGAMVPSPERSLAAPGKAEPGYGLSAPRIREFFPETLYWNPELVTDEKGRASLKIPGADSITTWRMAMSAVTRAGRLGSGEQPVRVFQPFFVDLDLPVVLTQGDEIWLPVAVYNYLQEPQAVTLAFVAESGFDVVGEREKKIEVRPGDVSSVRFHLRAREFGRHALLVKAIGTKFSDAVRRSIDVLPDGKEIPLSVSDRLTGASRTTIRIPAEAVDGASRLWLRLFPSTFSEIVTGLEGLVRLPYG